MDYRSYLSQQIERRRFDGETYRSLAKKCRLKSPNYLQNVVTGRRNLRLKTARQIASGLGFAKSEMRHFLALVREARPELASSERGAELIGLKRRGERKSVRDGSVHDSWLYAVLLELANVKTVALTEESAVTRLAGLATEDEVRAALAVLLRKKWLIREVGDAGGVELRRGKVEFEPLDDVRRIAIQRSHRRYLDMARHRLNDDLATREFRGLTVAIPEKSFAQVRTLIRDCVTRISELADEVGEADTVIRVQCCAFGVV